MNEIYSLDQFRNKGAAHHDEAEKQGAPLEASVAQPDSLTKAGRDFRARFVAALAVIEGEAESQLATAKRRSEVKVKISVAAVAKRAKASRLGAYSPLHHDVLLPLVEAASKAHERAMDKKFKRASQTKATVASLTAELRKEREDHAKAMTILASQRLSAFLELPRSRTS